MLVRFTDTKGDEVWINPVHVKLLREKKRATEIVMMLSSGLGNSVVKVTMSATDVAEQLNAAMPDLLPFPPDDDGNDDEGGAITAALMTG